MFSEALKLGQKALAGAGFVDDPDVVAEQAALKAATDERKQRLQVFFDNERMVMEEVEERAEFAEDLPEGWDESWDEDFDDCCSTDFDDPDWGDC